MSDQDNIEPYKNLAKIMSAALQSYVKTESSRRTFTLQACLYTGKSAQGEKEKAIQVAIVGKAW